VNEEIRQLQEQLDYLLQEQDRVKSNSLSFRSSEEVIIFLFLV
jgi:prefoldin subunit 5